MENLNTIAQNAITGNVANKKETTKRTDNIIVSNVNLLKEVIKNDVITEVQREKNQKEVIKKARKEKSENKKTISDAWKTATKSKSAIKKYIQDNSELIQPYLDNINTIYNTEFNIGVFNGTLENFAVTSEDYKINVDGKEINEKDEFRNVNWYLVLLERKAKYKDFSSNEFIEYDKKRLTAKCNAILKSELNKIDIRAKIELNKNEYKKFSKEFKLIGTNLYKENEIVLNSEILLKSTELLNLYLTK